jgi:hypothetical protein
MKKVIEYKVVTGNPKARFEENVMEFISQGWQPLGGLTAVALEQPVKDGKVVATFFSQAMVKYEEGISN